eukprot:9348-Heterococcus_DN1.PRE.1
MLHAFVSAGCLQVHEPLSSGPSDRLPVHGPDVRAGVFKLVWRIAALIKNRKTYEQHSISTLLADTHLQGLLSLATHLCKKLTIPELNAIGAHTILTETSSFAGKYIY